MLSTKLHDVSNTNGDIKIIGSYLPLPGNGPLLPVNAFLILGTEPALIDTGLAADHAAFLARVQEAIALEDLKWIFLTHVDADHVGNLREILAASGATVVTTFLGMGKLGLQGIQPRRVHLLNPGQALDIGDRTIASLRPPTFDAPETTAFFDGKTRALFSSDSFGALMPAPAEAASDLPSDALREGLTSWTMVDAPWLSHVREDSFRAAIDEVRRLDPGVVLSSHLPPAHGMLDTVCDHLYEARTAPPFIGPDQAAMEQLLAAESSV